MTSFILEYGNMILYAILTTMLSYVGMHIKNSINKLLLIKEKKEIVKTCVLASNKMYKNKTGDEKYNITVSNIKEVFLSKNINYSDFEVKLLIEEACNDIPCTHFYT